MPQSKTPSPLLAGRSQENKDLISDWTFHHWQKNNFYFWHNRKSPWTICSRGHDCRETKMTEFKTNWWATMMLSTLFFGALAATKCGVLIQEMWGSNLRNVVQRSPPILCHRISRHGFPWWTILCTGILGNLEDYCANDLGRKNTERTIFYIVPNVHNANLLS